MTPPLSKEPQKPATGNTLTQSRKFVVRLSLATGATFATLIGAQALALVDVPKVTPVTAQQPAATTTTNTIAGTTPGAIVVAPPNAAPQIVIIRNAGSPLGANTPLPRRNVASSPDVIAPPSIVEAPIQPEPPSQSSR